MIEAILDFEEISGRNRPLALLRHTGAVIACAFISACASFPGGGGDETPLTASAQEVEEAQMQVASLEAEVARLKSQNARLANEVLSLQRERDRRAAADEAAQAADEKELQLSVKPKPDSTASNETPPRSKAVVDDAASPALAKTDVPVETSPRLVQPTFASNETVFENEAENGDIKTESVLFGVHLASYRHLEEARAGWRKLQRENPDELGLLEPRVEAVTIEGKGKFLRLIGGGFAARDKAEALCGQLKANGLFCSVESFEGERLSLAENRG
jgi:hypothetical protein